MIDKDKSKFPETVKGTTMTYKLMKTEMFRSKILLVKVILFVLTTVLFLTGIALLILNHVAKIIAIFVIILSLIYYILATKLRKGED